MAIDDQASDHPVLGSEPPAAAHIQELHQEKQPTAEELIFSVASNVASQPLQNSNPEVWGVLTAINNNARKRKQVRNSCGLRSILLRISYLSVKNIVRRIFSLS